MDRGASSPKGNLSVSSGEELMQPRQEQYLFYKRSGRTLWSDSSFIHSCFQQRVIGHPLWPEMVLGAERVPAVHKTSPNPFFLGPYYIFMLFVVGGSRMEYVLQIWSDGCYRDTEEQKG